MSKDRVKLKSKYRIRKYDSDQDPETDEPKEVSEFEKNQFLTEGITKIWNLIGGIESTDYYDNAGAYIGVGDGTTSVSASQTGLQGSNIEYVGMDSGYPTVSGDTITFYATFGGTEANFAWEECSISNSADNTGDNINRKVSSQGSKSSGSTWELEVQLTLS